MALLQRTRILSQQRLDRPDFNNIEDFVCADFKASYKNLWSNDNFVFKGFVASGTGTDTLAIAVADSALVVGADDGTMYVGAPSLAAVTTDALTPAATNYVELTIEQDTGGADSRAFWDPTAAGGAGGEFSQIVDTFIFTKTKLNINTSNFTGSQPNVPICEVDVNGSGIITAIRDARNLFWRLGRRGAANHAFPWVSRTEPPTTQFNGADKDINDFKDWADAMMSAIREIRGTTYWYETSGPSIIGSFRNSALSMVTAVSTDAKWTWSGTVLTLTDSSGTPADADTLAALRLFDSASNLLLTRQDGTGGSATIPLADGDVLWVQIPDPLANVNYNAIGLTASNFRVSARGSVPNDDSTYWLAFREGSNCYLRTFGELQPGEEIEISDNVNENILAAIGIAQETDMPNYPSNNVVVDGTSLVTAVGALDAAVGLAGIGSDQDRSMKLIEGGTWSVDYLGTTLSWSASAFIDVPEVTRVSNEIVAGSILLPNPTSVAYVDINRASGAATLTVSVADIDAAVFGPNTVVIARRVGAGIIVGQHSFLLKAGEYLELDGALAEINRLLGQLRVTEHETAANKARISASDVNLLNSNVLSQIIGDFLLKFDGAVINFTTGAVLKADDVTALGVNFTPFTIPVGEYFWYGISLIPANVLADNTQEAQVQIDLAASANAVQATAPKPVLSGDIKLGAIQVHNNAGTIEIVDVHRLGVGSGSGSGSGDASAVDTALRDRFSLNNLLYLTENIFRTDKDDKVDLASTGAFSPAKKAFGFTAAAQTLISTDHLDADFNSSGADVTEIEFYLFWLQNFVDTAATYSVSRDGGVNWQTANMSRIGLTNAYRAYHAFTNEVTLTNLDSVAATGAGNALNATTMQELSSKLVLANTSVLRSIDFNLNYGGAGVGNVTARLVKDSAGVPSTSILDIVSESDAKVISTASLGGTGDITVTFDMPDVVLVAGTYHIVLITDAAYKAGTLDLSWRSAAGTDGGKFDGTAWASGESSKAHVAKGRIHDLRIRVTSSAGDKYVEGYGVYYGLTERGQALGQRKLQKFVFSGDENRTDFTTDFELDPEIVSAYDPLRGQVYVVEDGVLRNEGNTLKFAPDTFDFPGETIVLHVRQLEGNGMDTSNANAAAISEIQFNLLDIGEELASISDSMILPKILVPNTTILNRATMPDLSQDLKPRFAIDRMTIQKIYELQDEQGPNGESVFGVANDKFNQIRLVGSRWRVDSASDTFGPHAQANEVGSYLEITFYGTGLNILLAVNATANTFQYSLDGAPLTTFFSGAVSGVLDARNYSTNQVIPVVSTSFGMHTVKVLLSAGTFFSCYGFEILNENASGLIQLPPGAQLYKGKRRTHSILETTPYNSVFETGTLGTRGGRVLIYQKADGSVAKAATPTDATTLTSSSASHANEEVTQLLLPRKFGAGRTDDFSLVNTGSNVKVSTLDDGTTTLIGSGFSLGSPGGGAPECLNLSFAGGNFAALTFVGTGLDVNWASDATGTNGAANAFEVYIDGVFSFNWTTTAVLGAVKLQKIVSGLPFGSHTVMFLRNTVSTWNLGLRSFVVYSPKRPAIPSGAVELSDYSVMATFAANATAGGRTTSTGVLQKTSMREFIYVQGTGGTSDWALNTTANGTNAKQGSYAISDRLNAYVEYTFFGTGFDSRWVSDISTSANNIQVSLAASGGSLQNLTTTNFPTAAFSTYGMSTGGFTGATGILSTRDGTGVYGAGFVCSGLPLGVYKVRFNNGTAGATQFMNFHGLDIITPIHSPKNNGPFVLQNTLPIGSQGISDLRKFSKKDVGQPRKTSQATGITSSPTTTATIFVPCPDMSTEIKSSGQQLKISYAINLQGSISGTAVFTLVYINGVAVGGERLNVAQSSGHSFVNSDSFVVPAAPGTYKVDVYWRCNANTITAEGIRRNLLVEEVD